MENQLQTQTQQPVAGSLSFFDRVLLSLDNLEQVKEVGMAIINTGFCPDHFKNSQDAVGLMMCVATGQKFGLDIMQSMQLIVPIKGAPTLKGDLIRDLIRMSPVCILWEERYEGTPGDDGFAHIIKCQRRGGDVQERRVSIADAKRWGLFLTQEQIEKNAALRKEFWAKPVSERTGKQAPPDLSKSGWARYYDRMLMYRNIGFVGRDVFGDVIKGMASYEERQDYENVIELKEVAPIEKNTVAASPKTTTTKKAEKKAAEKPVEKPVVGEYVDAEQVEPDPEPTDEVKPEVKPEPEPVKPEPVAEEAEAEKSEINAAILESVQALMPENNRMLHHTSAFRAALVKNYPQKFPSIKEVPLAFENVGVSDFKSFLQNAPLTDICLALQKIIEQ